MSGNKPVKPASVALALVLLVATVALYVAMKPGPDGTDPPEPPPSPLSDLGSPPIWTKLSNYDRSMTASELETLLTKVFTLGDTWREFISIDENQATIRTSLADPAQTLTLALAKAGQLNTPPRYWKSPSELPPLDAAQPLAGLKIALDPGHIGGSYARLEERWFQISEGEPVMEGEMALAVAKLVKPQLEALGATVILVRETTDPVTGKREQDFLEQARAKLRSGSPQEIRALSERLFYRTAEIRERARKVNEDIQPDLVVCIHFNAEPWGDPSTPALTDANHCHFLLNGAYTPSEIEKDDVRFEMLNKLLQGIHAEEATLGASAAQAFAEVTELPPYLYKPDSSRALNVDNNPYLWARNLLANRLYQCPVLFLEPYVMNSNEVYERIQAGDYDGTRLVAGKERLSLYKEYAKALVTGLAKHYREHRTSSP